ncbi:alpha-glycosidase [Paenibacillus hexagrammi]|uniref:Alpha-glycosidase n=1 Tax=Paenibacillus hexagrammi TaxID=2908839 RepID=A0ABY3SD72_9BACL|nr:alpha-glycosidase [Paenibacillus sp. YPD9-1]UJF31757.1 alpha-glycosidase [Paenibacillus sp. YPD9-1]
MNLHALYHRSKQSWAYAYDLKTVKLRLRTERNDIETVDVVYGDKYNWNMTEQTASMHKWMSDELYDYWEAAVQPPNGRLSYRFYLKKGESRIWYSERWCKEQPPKESFGNFEYPYLSSADIISPPSWVKDAVFYQIFPERFANGNPAISPAHAQPWGGTPTTDNYFGGDLQGVIDHLDYLAELGINAIYLNPLFLAPSYHKYDTIDYWQVDPHFGTNETLKQLVTACHAKGIRVLLDLVFNHCGSHFPPFVDVLEKGQDSKYADWFLVREWPMQVKDGKASYETFGFEPTMPKFNTANPELCEYLLNIAKFWIEETDIDGYRLDVANEVDHRFWRKLREVVKAAKPEAFLLGEIMHDSMAWLQGDQLDAVMNYPVTDFALKFFVKNVMDSREFADAIATQLTFYPQQVNEAAFNLLSSHDIPRLLTLCKGNKDRMKLASIFQFTYPGAPCMYYGDEIGLTGENDPDNRKCMEWNTAKQDHDLLDFFKKAIAMRKKYASLRYGDFIFLSAEPKDFRLIYERKLGEERFVIIMNAAPHPQRIDAYISEGEWEDAWNGGFIEVGMAYSVTLPGFGFQILRAKELKS